MHRLAGESAVHQMTTQRSVQLETTTKDTCRGSNSTEQLQQGPAAPRGASRGRKPKDEGLTRPGLCEEGGLWVSPKRSLESSRKQVDSFSSSPWGPSGWPISEKQSPWPPGPKPMAQHWQRAPHREGKGARPEGSPVCQLHRQSLCAGSTCFRCSFVHQRQAVNACEGLFASTDPQTRASGCPQPKEWSN